MNFAAFAATYFGDADAVPWERLDDYMAAYDFVQRLWTLAIDGRSRSIA